MKKNNKRSAFSPWIFPLLSVLILVFVLSVRLLSDPDLGSHLRAGKWISENHAFPQKETFTYGAYGNDYTDMHWLFQLGIYQLYKLTGYDGLSLFVSALALSLFLLLLFRNRNMGIPVYITCMIFLAGFLVIEQRFTLRPEMVTFLFITLSLIILDQYYHYNRNLLFLLPVIMLFWVNTHGLFVLGIFLSGSYWISLLIRDRKIHLKFLLWMVLSVIACLANPYFMRGITFPVELITRFDAQNIFHQHIRELKSFWLLDQFVLKDLLFIGFAGITMLMTILTIGKRKVHEFILLAVFLYMALVAVRNLGLFIVISIPILGASLRDLKDLIKKNQPASVLVARSRVLKIILFVLLILIPLGLIPRVWTNNYYISNHSYSKTGTGIDPDHQPVMVSEFLTRHKLDGRLLNSIAFGGWLSWSLPQPVFIDGRLEVMTEPLYQEVVDSWDWGLNRLVKKYQPEMIVYNYVKYYPWTVQLAADPGWRVIYLDGFAAVFVKKDYVPELPSVNFRNLPASCGLTPEMTNEQENKILQASPEGTFKTWFSGFYKKNNENIANFQNIASFCLQLKQDSIAERFFIESLRLSENRNTSVYYALADIYREQGENEKAGICYTRILSFDPGNETVFNALTSLNQISPVVPEKGSRVEAEARAFYNSGNQKYRYGDVEGALFDYSKAIAIKPDYFKAYNNRGIAKALGLKKYKDAIEDFNKAIGIKPDYADAWLGRGTAKYNMNDPAGACSDWEKARALGSRQAEDMILQYCKK